MGHLVCAVIADSEVQAKKAAGKVRIVYQDLEPLVLTIEVGQPGAGRLWRFWHGTQDRKPSSAGSQSTASAGSGRVCDSQ